MIIDRLFERVEEVGNVCIGLDIDLDYIPRGIKEKYENISQQIYYFNKMIIDATYDITAIYKLQIAYYEAYGIEGLKAYIKTLEYIRERGLFSIGDIKRGDISKTAEMYAKAHFEGEFETDFITVNPYMGFDSISPYLKYLESGEKGIFVLLRTSNPGAKDVEYLNVDGEYLYYKIGDGLEKIGSDFIGENAYSSLGFVVGGTHSDEIEEIRKRYENTYFLIPGYGAQGGVGKEIRGYLPKGNGGIVNSSRGIIKAYMKYKDGYENFEKYTREAVMSMREDLGYEG